MRSLTFLLAITIGLTLSIPSCSEPLKIELQNLSEEVFVLELPHKNLNVGPGETVSFRITHTDLGTGKELSLALKFHTRQITYRISADVLYAYVRERIQREKRPPRQVILQFLPEDRLACGDTYGSTEDSQPEGFPLKPVRRATISP